MRLSTENKLHQVLQENGVHCCPFDPKEDSICRPPKPDITCPKDLKCGYNIFKEGDILCVFYHTRCPCTYKREGNYRKEAEGHLKNWLPLVQRVCPRAEIEWSKQGRPYITTHEQNIIDAVDTPAFYCPLSSPYSEITLIPLTSTE